MVVGLLVPCPWHEHLPTRIVEARYTPTSVVYEGDGNLSWTSAELDEYRLECGVSVSPLGWQVWAVLHEEHKGRPAYVEAALTLQGAPMSDAKVWVKNSLRAGGGYEVWGDE